MNDWRILEQAIVNRIKILCFAYHQPKLDAWDKRLDLVHWEDLEGSGGEGGGRGDRDGEHM